MTQLITTELVELDQNLGNDPEAVIRHLASKVAATGRATEVEGLFADAFAREQKTATGIPGGIAIPHCRSAAVVEPTLAMARLSPKVDFGAKDGPADLDLLHRSPGRRRPGAPEAALQAGPVPDQKGLHGSPPQRLLRGRTSWTSWTAPWPTSRPQRRSTC